MRERLASLVLRLLASTWRIRVHGTLPDERCIIAFWHGTMLPVWCAMRKAKPTAVVSASNDGSLLAQLLTDWGYCVVRGSSSKGGSEALNAMVEAAATSVVMITPDGPRGPRHQAKAGAVVAAHRAAIPVVPISVTIGKAKIFDRSWDRFAMPLPFASIVITVGEPLTIPDTASREEIDGYVVALQNRLNQGEDATC